jgi:hypothetical protein
MDDITAIRWGIAGVAVVATAINVMLWDIARTLSRLVKVTERQNALLARQLEEREHSRGQ